MCASKYTRLLLLHILITSVSDRSGQGAGGIICVPAWESTESEAPPHELDAQVCDRGSKRSPRTAKSSDGNLTLIRSRKVVFWRASVADQQGILFATAPGSPLDKGCSIEPLLPLLLWQTWILLFLVVYQSEFYLSSRYHQGHRPKFRITKSVTGMAENWKSIGRNGSQQETSRTTGASWKFMHVCLVAAFISPRSLKSNYALTDVNVNANPFTRMLYVL